MKIIGLTGKKGSGKDTVADILLKNKVIEGKFALANNLRKICADVFSGSYHHYSLNQYKDKEFDYSKPLVLLDFINIQKSVKSIYDEDYLLIPNKKVEQYIGKTLKTPREILQFVGTEIIRDLIDSKWHLKSLFREDLIDGIYAITDIRFKEEHNYLKEKFGSSYECYYVNNSKLDNQISNHKSEQEFDLFKHETKIINNNGDIDDLIRELEHKFNFSYNRELSSESKG